MFHDFPWTDMHELNLDWFLARFKELVEEWNSVKEDWNSLHDYVQNYFNNLNVQTEIDHKLDELVADGTLATIMEPYVAQALPSVVDGKLPAVVASQIGAVVASQINAVIASQLPDAVAGEAAAWLEANVDPETGYVIDDSLTIAGAAADAKTTGDKIRNLRINYKFQYCDYNNATANTRYTKISESSVGTQSATNYVAYPPIKVKAGTYYFKNLINLLSYAKTSSAVTSFKNIMGEEVTSGTITLASDCEIYMTGSTTVGVAAFSDSSIFPTVNTFGSYDLTYDGIDLIKDDSILNGFNIIPMAASSYSNGTLTITPTDDTYVFNAGTPSANGYYTLYNGSLPAGCYIGESYLITMLGFTHAGWQIEVHAYVSGEWVLLAMKTENVEITIPSGTTAIRFRIAITRDIAWNNEVLTIKGFSVKSVNYVNTRMHWNYPHIPEKPIITIIDDDGNPRFYEYLLPVIQSKQVPIASAVITGWVGTSSEMTWDQIEDAYRKGAEILSHTDSHYEYDEWLALDTNEIAFNFIKSLHKIRNHGIKCNGLVYTGQSGNYLKIINANKYASDYGFRAGTNHTNQEGTDRYQIERWGFSVSSTLQDFKDKIDDLISAGTGWQVWMIHTSDAFTQTNADIIAGAIDYALANDIQIVTTEYGVSKYCK